jgi:hypothetical protein
LPKPRKNRRLWEIDPTIFQPGRKATILERIVQPFRSLARYLLYVLALAYPTGLVILGIAFGGLVFWGAFAGSIAAMGIIITKSGYARNFQNWDISLRKMGALPVAFLMTLGFYLGLIYLKIWLVPVMALIMGLGLYLVVKKAKT